LTEIATTAILDNFELTDPALTADHLPYCTLCIELNMHYLQFCIVENISSQCRWLASYRFSSPQTRNSLLIQVQNIIEQHPLLIQAGLGNIVVSFHSPSFTYVPAPLFRADLSNEYLGLMLPQGLHPEDQVYEDKLRIIDAHAVFSAPSVVVNWFTNHYPDKTIRFCHHTEPLIYATITENYHTITGRRANIITENNRLTLIIVEGPRFIFGNSFPYTTPEELTYLVLYVMNQLDIEPAHIKIILHGDTFAGSGEHKELCRFFPDVEMGKKPQSLSYSHRINDVEAYRFYNLLNTYFMVF